VIIELEEDLVGHFIENNPIFSFFSVLGFNTPMPPITIYNYEHLCYARLSGLWEASWLFAKPLMTCDKSVPQNARHFFA
jgi:hypothetical protein